MEMARAIVADVLAREKMRKESILVSQNIFELRTVVKDFKRKNNLRGDDEDLYESSKVSSNFSTEISGTLKLTNSGRAGKQTFFRLLHQFVEAPKA